MAEVLEDVGQIAQTVWERDLATQPLLRLRRGLPVEELRGWGLEEAEEDASFARRTIAALDALDPSSLDHDDALTAAFLRHSLTPAVHAPTYYWHASPVTPYSNPRMVSYLVQMVLATHRFDDTASADRYLRLVADLVHLLRQCDEKLQGQRERGILVPRPALPGARETLRLLAVGATALVPAAERLAALGPSAGAVRERIERAVTDEVVPALQLLASRLDDDYARAAPDEVGLGQYEGGAAAYRHAIRAFNTLDADPEQVHALGLEQVQELADRMADVRSALGFSGTEAEFHDQLRDEPSLHAADADEVEARYLGYMARLEPLLPQWFAVLPEAPYGVTRLAPELEPAMTYGYYEPPNPERPIGRYHYNASQLDQRSLLNAAAIIYHELAPGHHFHIARQAENTALPDIRREAIAIGAFNEGWAEYAAGLAWEMGLYETPLEQYGRLSHERFIAQRLVVDTGMNVLGWTLDRGRAFMREHTVESDLQVSTETLRYATDLPAQALGYRLGHLRILEARRKAEHALGARFDVRGFHEAILGQGALPLPVLEEHLEWWTEQQARR